MGLSHLQVTRPTPYAAAHGLIHHFYSHGFSRKNSADLKESVCLFCVHQRGKIIQSDFYWEIIAPKERHYYDPG